MSIESQATFYYHSVSDYESNCKINMISHESIATGFHQFSTLLRRIYSDWRSYETSTVESTRTKIGIMTDDLENYHNLTYTINCLYLITVAGELCSESEMKYLEVNKAIFKTLYKQSATFSFEMLEKYGFQFTYFKNQKEIIEYRRCDSFHFFHENGSSLIESMKYLADTLSHQENQKEMPKNVAFMLADYHFILAGERNLDPLQESIVNVLGAVSDLWNRIVTTLLDECKLAVELSFNPYVFPHKIVTFRYSKKTICKFNIEVDRLSIRLPLTYQIAKELISNRSSLPQSIDENINWFGCVNCGKCKNQSNIEMFEGVRLCNLSYSNFVTEDSRCLRFTISNREEVNVVLDIIKKSLCV